MQNNSLTFYTPQQSSLLLQQNSLFTLPFNQQSFVQPFILNTLMQLNNERASLYFPNQFTINSFQNLPECPKQASYKQLDSSKQILINQIPPENQFQCEENSSMNSLKRKISSITVIQNEESTNTNDEQQQSNSQTILEIKQVTNNYQQQQPNINSIFNNNKKQQKIEAKGALKGKFLKQSLANKQNTDCQIQIKEKKINPYNLPVKQQVAEGKEYTILRASTFTCHECAFSCEKYSTMYTHYRRKHKTLLKLTSKLPEQQ